MSIFTFDNQTFELINYGLKDNVYFKAIEIARFLGYSDTDKAIRKFVWDSNKYMFNDIHRKLNPAELAGSKKQHMKTIYISESGLYQLIFRSKMPFAETFQKWVIDDVLPKIRKTGKYKLDVNKQIRMNLTFNIQNEFDLHTQLINFLKVQYPNILLTICNPELSNDTFQKRKQCFLLGYQPGTFDILINNLHKKYTGFALEIKTPNGKGNITDNQKQMEKRYQENGFKTLISNSYNECIYQIIEYMSETRIKCIHCKNKFKNNHTLNNHLKFFHKIKNLD